MEIIQISTTVITAVARQRKMVTVALTEQSMAIIDSLISNLGQQIYYDFGNYYNKNLNLNHLPI